MSTSQVRYSLTVGDDSIDITNDKTGRIAMSLSFMRTIRVPDNNEVNDLPPSLGKFPLQKVRDYIDRLPKKVAAKGGAFFPMHQKEAMWIKFKARAPFIVKVYAGGINAISGEHRDEDISTKFRRVKDHLSGKKTQDYAVLPDQLWLDGIAVSPGVVRQFVAMPLGEGYGIEAQMTGHEVTGGLQFEFTPLKEEFMPGSYPLDRVTIKTLTGKTFQVPCYSDWTVFDLKEAVQDAEGIPPYQQRFIFAGLQLEDSGFLTTYGVKEDSIIHLLLRLRGGGRGRPPFELCVAAGGSIRQELREDLRNSQDWDHETTLAIPIQILNTEAFHQVTGRKAPPCPITAADYAEAGYPFFHLDETPGVGLGGNFGAAKSVNERERQRGLAAGPEGPVLPHIMTIDGHDTTTAAQAEAVAAKAQRAAHLAQVVQDDDGLLSPDGPYRPFRTTEHIRTELEAVDPHELEKEAPELMAEFLKLRC